MKLKMLYTEKEDAVITFQSQHRLEGEPKSLST